MLVGSYVSAQFEVRYGLRQGCTITPTLFNIHFMLGGEFALRLLELLCCIRRLVGDCTVKSRLERVQVMES